MTRPKPTWHKVGGLKVCMRDGQPFDEQEFVEALKNAGTSHLSHLPRRLESPEETGMTSHHPPQLIIDNTHRITLADEWCAEHLQVETEESRLYSASDMGFAFFLGGLFFSLIFAAVAWIVAGVAL